MAVLVIWFLVKIVSFQLLPPMVVEVVEVVAVVVVLGRSGTPGAARTGRRSPRARPGRASVRRLLLLLLLRQRAVGASAVACRALVLAAAA